MRYLTIKFDYSRFIRDVKHSMDSIRVRVILLIKPRYFYVKLNNSEYYYCYSNWSHYDTEVLSSYSKVNFNVLENFGTNITGGSHFVSDFRFCLNPLRLVRIRVKLED